jgi:hypothetical protein
MAIASLRSEVGQWKKDPNTASHWNLSNTDFLDSLGVNQLRS